MVAEPTAVRRILAVLLFFAAVPYVVDLGGSSIWDANEAFYVETPREMIERGDYVLPTFNYEPRINKPVLSYWIVAGFYHVFGISVAVQRIPIAIGGLLLVAIAFFLGRAAFRAVPGTAADATTAGLWAALGLAISPRLVMFSRRIFVDIYITLFMAATLLFFLLAERYPQRRRLFLVLMYVSVGLGVLTKGPVAAALPGLVFLLYLLAGRDLLRAREMMIPTGIAIVLAIVAPWYVALAQRENGWDYIVSFFLGENVGRFREGIGVDQGRGPLFYVGVLLGDGFPWILLVVSAALVWGRSRFGQGEPWRAPLLLLLWIATIVVFFSFSASKQDLYIYSVMPAVAALGGIAIAARAPGARWMSGAIGVLVALAGAGVLYVFHASGNVYALSGVFAVGLVTLVGGAVAAALAFGGRWQPGLLVVCAAFVALNWIFVLRVLPSFEKYKPVPRLTAFLQPRVTPDDVVLHYSVAMPSMVYYMRRHIEVTYDRATFFEAMRQPERVFAMLWTEEYARLKDDIGVPTCAIHEVPSFNVKLGAVIRREPLPHVVVITNDCP